MQVAYISGLNHRQWKHSIDDEVDYRHFINTPNYKKIINSMHPSEMYGLKNFLAWRFASDYLSSIPVGTFGYHSM